MPYEHTSPPPSRPASTPAWVHQGLLVLGAVLMTVSLISNSGVIKGLTIASGAGLVGTGLGVLARRSKATGAE